MNAKWGSVSLSAAFLLLGSIDGVSGIVVPTLAKPTERPGLVHPDADPTVIRQRRISIDLNLVRDARNGKLKLDLFDGTSVVLVRNRLETPRPGTVIWSGHVENQPGSMVVLSNVADALAGDVITRDRAGRFGNYQIRYLGDAVHILNQIDASKFPPEDPPNHPNLQPIPPDETCGDSGAVIDVLAVYSGAARDAAGSTPPGLTNSGIEAEIYEAVAVTNLTYENSGIAHRLRLVHLQEVSFSEIGKTPTEQLAALQNGTGGLADVLPLRDAYAADVVVLIVRSLPNACGKSNIMDPPASHAFESQAYAVVMRNCMATEFTLAHEFGHIMGAYHDWDSDPTPGVLYSHGYINRTPTSSATGWRTLMAVDPNCLDDPPVNCAAIIPNFSNPNVSYPVGSSDRTGIGVAPHPSDNHMRLNETASIVANFRCTPSGPNNVWIKDTDDDTGAEPDPLTAGEDMWKSPSIWIRTAQDSAGVHLHEHENPVAGKLNWMYVEIKNGGGKVFGELETYYADASTSLLWPTGWTPIDKTPVDFNPTSTQIIEVRWTPPQAGHYCLLARWASPADPMTVAETGNIEANVRGNNNIVWKNVNVIDLTGAQSAMATFMVRPPEDGSSFSIVVRGMGSRGGAYAAVPFRLTIELDDALVTAWRRGGARARNLRLDGKKFSPAEPGEALLSNLHLEPGAMGRVTLTFERTNAPPERDLIVDVMQRREDAGAGARPIGGVSYVVRTNR